MMTREAAIRVPLRPATRAATSSLSSAIAKRRDWILWELHEEVAHLEDVFHHLTAEGGVNE